jgi:hypothetical protein
MRSLRSALQQSPAVVVSVAALMFAAGTGVSFAASSAPSAAAAKAEHAAVTKLNWHRLPLSKGWQGVYNGAYRGFRYAVSNGVVYLSGYAISPRHFSGGWMATLPRGARPASAELDMPVVIGTRDLGLIQVLDNGRIYPVFPRNVVPFGVWLSGISFGLGS